MGKAKNESHCERAGPVWPQDNPNGTFPRLSLSVQACEVQTASQCRICGARQIDMTMSLVSGGVGRGDLRATDIQESSVVFSRIALSRVLGIKLTLEMETQQCRPPLRFLACEPTVWWMEFHGVRTM